MPPKLSNSIVGGGSAKKPTPNRPKAATPVKATTAPQIVAPVSPIASNPVVATGLAGAIPATTGQITSAGAGAVTPSGGNPTGSGWNGGSTDAVSGYLARFGYTPNGLASLYDNPAALAGDVLGMQGITNPGMAQQLADLFDSALAGQFIANRGGSPSDNDTLNFIAHAMNQANTPGGQYLDYDYLLNTILGATNADANALGAYLQQDAQGNALTPAQQAQTVNALASQALVGLNPYAQRAYSGALGAQGREYQTAAAKGQSLAPSYVEYLANSPFARWF